MYMYMYIDTDFLTTKLTILNNFSETTPLHVALSRQQTTNKRHAYTYMSL